MFGLGGKLSLKTVDDEIVAGLNEGLAEVEKFAGELPLVGISVQGMHDIEAKGIALCQARLAEIKAEIARLETERVNTEAIIDAGLAKIGKLFSFLKPVAPPVKGDPGLTPTVGPAPVEVPAAVHTDIQV